MSASDGNGLPSQKYSYASQICSAVNQHAAPIVKNKNAFAWKCFCLNSFPVKIPE